MKDGSLLERVNRELKRMYDEYNDALEQNDLDRALEIGCNMLEELLSVANEIVLPVIMHPKIREVAKSIVSHHEKMLAFVRGTKEALRQMPPIYSFGAKEKAVEVLTSSINGLFSFVIGAMLVMADMEFSARSVLSKDKTGKSANEVPNIV